MKIVYITPNYLPHIGGVEIYVNNLANFFSKEGEEIVVITADVTINHIQVYMENSIKILRIPVFSLSGILFVKNISFLSMIREEIEEADIVHLNDCKFLYSYLAKKKKNYHYKLFLSSHGFIFHTNNHLLIKKFFFKNIVTRYQKFYNKFICVSEQDENIAKEYQIKNTCRVYPGVNIYKFSNIPNKCNKNDICFMYWGRIAPNKGIIECLTKLASLKFDYKAIFIGKADDENYMAKIDSILNEKELLQKVMFVGPKTDEEIKEQISRSNYILMPSLHEGFGMTLAECLLSNRKIIANTNTSFTYILKTVNAEQFLFNFEDANSDLNKKIEELNNIQIKPKEVEQFSDTEMYKKIKKIYLD